MARICLCLTAKTLKRNMEALEKYREFIDLAELRVDCLEKDERLRIRDFPGAAGLPVILTIRRKRDGGHYEGGEGARITLLAKALAFADADRRRNFAYVDIEDDLNAASIEEAARTFGTRIIRSFHNTSGVDDNLAERLRGMRRAGDEIVKAAVTPRSLGDAVKVWRAARELGGIDKILLCVGDYGAHTRILAEKLGAFLTYTSAAGESDMPLAAPGQIDPRTLSELYRFRSVTAGTKVFGITGFPLAATASPRFFNAVFTLENIDAVYVPFPADTISAFLRLAEEIPVAGAAVTVPHKQAALSCLSFASPEAAAIGACNTLVASPQGWRGYNTDAPGFSDSLLAFLGRKNLKHRCVTIVGAGGAARAVAAEVHRLGGKGLVLNRTPGRARELALNYGFAWGAPDHQGASLMEKYNHIIIQTTSAGMTPNTESDPLDFYKFSGREVVMDLIYKPERTKCLARAQAAGCKTLNGYDMLLRQARYQYTRFMGREFPAHAERAGREDD
ncbi:MAG: type I 3-dehydroquinate dehydratase [Treponematales bacterium]